MAQEIFMFLQTGEIYCLKQFIEKLKLTFEIDF